MTTPEELIKSVLCPFGDTEWGTDTWGEILSEPNEAHARSVAGGTGARLYTRPAMGKWVEVPLEDLDAREAQAREAVEQ